LLYYDGILYVLNDHVWLQTLQAKHDVFGYKSFSIQQGHGINVSRLLVATTLEVCEGVRWIVWYLRMNKKWWSSPTCVWINPYIMTVFNSMDFITNLSCSNSYNSILMVADPLINNHPNYFLIMFSDVIMSLYYPKKLDEVFWTSRHKNEVIISFPPLDRWANKIGQSNRKMMFTLHNQLSLRQLVKTFCAW
jgi:hypothetical protein